MQGEDKFAILQQLRDFGVVPVVAINQAEDAIPLGQALLSGGLPCAEITFRTAAAEEAIQRIASELPEILIGAGTVLNIEQAERAVSAGARFIVSPYVNVKFIPTGGVNLENLADYLRLPSVHACGGSWLVKRSLIGAGDFDEITRRAREALEVVHQVRTEGGGL
jgi:2-dehydro-3-deoxyphosphogluconate aldolase/(4S)-4-hydroxy-2-oxoglutarate aldolase